MNKTFAELGYNVGDTVRCVDDLDSSLYVTGGKYLLGHANEELTVKGGYNGRSATWELVSRAGSTVTADDEYPIWGDMTPEAQGALLLAEHNGAVIQMASASRGTWIDMDHKLSWFEHVKYRVKPADPVVVTHELFGRHGFFWSVIAHDVDTHKMTYNTIDGVIDCASVKMMKIDKP